jgi:hypothetical protein
LWGRGTAGVLAMCICHFILLLSCDELKVTYPVHAGSLAWSAQRSGLKPSACAQTADRAPCL